VTDKPITVVDAHIHQWDPFTTPRVTSGAAKITRRAPLLLPLLVRMLPRASRDFVGDPHHVLTPYRPRDYAADASLVTHLDQAFGPDRTFWSSNYPMDKPNISLPDTIWALRQILGDRFDETRMLRDNARRVYRISATQPRLPI
jgi:predicted TIM-barrel fold metal-dependent hydrolase